MRIVDADASVALVEYIAEVIKAGNDLAELDGEAQVAPLLGDLVGQQQPSDLRGTQIHP